jgi:bifunctional DNase/RNase
MPRKKKKSNAAFITLMVLILVSIMAYAVINIVDMNEYVIADVLEVSGTTIIIGNNCSAIVAETSPERAYSIELGKIGLIEERPTTHDVFSEVLKSFNITLDHVQIESFDDQYYYAYLFLMSGDKILRLDTKPSDGIALALRTDSPIYIKKTLLEQVGRDIC